MKSFQMMNYPIGRLATRPYAPFAGGAAGKGPFGTSPAAYSTTEVQASITAEILHETSS